MSQAYRELSSLKPQAKKAWNLLKGELLRNGGISRISHADFANLCDSNCLNCSVPSARRLLIQFEKLGLIKIDRTKEPHKYILEGYEKEHKTPINELTGVVPIGDKRYLEREADSTCKQDLIGGAFNESYRPFIRLRAAKGMGKTSLLRKIQEFLENEQNHVVGFVDLSCPDYFSLKDFDDLDTLFEQFTKAVTETFKNSLKKYNLDILKDLPNLQEYWKQPEAAGLKCGNYLHDYIFSKINRQPKTLLIDGIDEVLGKATQDPFLKVFRTWNELKMKKVVSNVPIEWPSIVISYSTEYYLKQGVKGSVLDNVGTVVLLKEFDRNQIIKLAGIYNISQNSIEEQVDSLMNLIGGHPALVNLSLYKMSREAMNVSELEAKINQINGPYWNYLYRVLEQLKSDDKLSNCFKKILKNESCKDEYAISNLDKAGLIDTENNEIKVRFELYRKFFDGRL